MQIVRSYSFPNQYPSILLVRPLTWFLTFTNTFVFKIIFLFLLSKVTNHYRLVIAINFATPSKIHSFEIFMNSKKKKDNKDENRNNSDFFFYFDHSILPIHSDLEKTFLNMSPNIFINNESYLSSQYLNSRLSS